MPVSTPSNASLKRRLADFSRKYPLLCRLERSTPEGSVTYVLDKSRLSIRLIPPYSEERKAAASAYAKEQWLSGGDNGRKNRLKLGRLRAKNAGSVPGVLTGNPRRRIPYPLPAERRKCVDAEPVKLAETASAVEASFAGREYRGRQALCAGVQGRQALLGSRGNAHWRVEGSRPIGSRAKRLAQGKLMPASTCNGYYLTQTFAGFAASPPFPVPGTSSQEGGKLFETDTT